MDVPKEDGAQEVSVRPRFPRYAAIEEALRETLFDPYQHAINLAKVRLNYAETARQLLLSPNISQDEKLRFGARIDKRVDERVKIYKTGDAARKAEMLSIYKGKYFLPPKERTIENYVIFGSLDSLETAIVQWRYFYQSLRNLKGSSEEVRGAQYLLQEAFVASYCADYDNEIVPETPYYINECFFTRSLVDSLAYYLFTRNEIEKKDLATALFCLYRPIHQTDKIFKGLGEWFSQSLLDPVLLERINSLNIENSLQSALDSVTRVEEELDNVLKLIAKAFGKPTTEDQLRNYIIMICNNDLNYKKTYSNYYRILYVFAKESHNNEKKKNFLRLFLNPQTVGLITDLDKYERTLASNPELKKTIDGLVLANVKVLDERIREKEEEIDKSFVVALPRSKKSVKKEGKKRAPIKANVAPAPIETPSTAIVEDSRSRIDAERLAQQKKKVELKKSQKKKREQDLIEERMQVFERNKLNSNAILEDIRFEFEPGWEPSLEELVLYKLLWSSKNETDSLCWNELFSRLKSFGWTENTRDGSSVLLIPPIWLSQVKTEGKGALKINRAGILIDHPHKRAVAPMPDYVFYFLTAAFERNLGLSKIMIDALVKSLGTEKTADNSNDDNNL